jgi:tRNA-Thr(GGU) m(6)t(6)A37 methyltransferase TsaA
MAFRLEPVGVVRTTRDDPGDSDHWGSVVSDIEIDDRFGDDCLQGLQDFSHAEVVFVFDRAAEREEYVPRPPRGRDDLPAVGVFAERGPRRPNRLGVSYCEIVSVDRRRLTVRGLDAVDATPVVDIKPGMTQFLPAAVRQPDWVDRLMAEYHLP